jgi:cytochrome c peroxidase
MTAAFLGATSSPFAADEPIQPIRPVQDINLAQAELGKKPYFDPVCRRLASYPATPATT